MLWLLPIDWIRTERDAAPGSHSGQTSVTHTAHVSMSHSVQLVPGGLGAEAVERRWSSFARSVAFCLPPS